MTSNLTHTELSNVCDVIADNTGLHFPIERWSILGRNLALSAREFGFKDMESFLDWILSSKLNDSEIKVLASHLTVSETYFWREPHVFNALTNFILPEIIKSKKKSENSIRIWSAGCSTGEEPYSIAMALHKTIQNIREWKIEILATDINPKSLEKATAAIYGNWSFRNTPKQITDTYFHKIEEHKYRVIPEISKMVTFKCHSLTDDNYFTNLKESFDIIFCRNVLMYFTDDWVNKISRNLYNSIKSDGWFIISSSELSSQIFTEYTPVNFPGAVLYRKGKYEPKPEINFDFPTIYQSEAINLTPKSTINEIEKKNPSHTLPLSSSPILPITPSSSDLDKPKPATSDTKIFAIRLLADQGYLAEALELCNEVISEEKLSARYYFIKAAILQEMDKNTEAIASLKKAIYIDNDHIMGQFTLGNLYVKQGIDKNAKRHFSNVLNLLKDFNADDIPAESEGLSVKYIREICLANMQTR